MPRRWTRSLRRELQVLRRDNPRALLAGLAIWLLASGGLGAWLWADNWQLQRRQQLSRSETQLGLLDLRVTSHKVTVLDWGHWDPMVKYVGGADPGFPQREVEASSIVDDGLMLVVAGRDRTLQAFPPAALTPALRTCLLERLESLASRTPGERHGQSYGFFCRSGDQAYIGAGTEIQPTRGKGPHLGWLLHLSRIERPSYNAAVNAAFRQISNALERRRRGEPSDGARPAESVSALLPPGELFMLLPGVAPLDQKRIALQSSIVPWLFFNGVALAGGGATLLGLRRLRLSQRRSDWRNRSRLRQLRQELPGPLLSQRDLIEALGRDTTGLSDCWMGALQVHVAMFSSGLSRSAAQVPAMGQLGERLQRRRGTRLLALGEERTLLLVFRPEHPRRPELELQHLNELLQELQIALTDSIKLAVRGVIVPLDPVRARQQLSDLPLVLSMERGTAPLQFHPEGVHAQAEQLRQQLHIDFSVSHLVENLRDHRYQLEPVVELVGQERRVAYCEMLFRLPEDMEHDLTVQEVILSLERNNNVHLIDQLMLRKAIELLRANPDPERRLGINLSAVSFGMTEHFDELTAQLRSLPEPLRKRLVVEITETAIIEKPELWSMKLQQLRDLGLQIAIDDFGVGFASIAYLFRFRADYLKLDLSYSQRLHDSNVDALVQFLLSYGAHNDCRLILEGIETQEQLEVWSRQGVNLFQGYLFHDRIAVPCASTAARLRSSAES
ncbi:MAG: EAL domain-containing protein [Vulcanococcus sp.]